MQAIYKELGPVVRYGRKFGTGGYPSETDPDYESRTLYGQTLAEAWCDGCPIPTRVIEKYGLKGAITLYKNYNRIFDFLVGDHDGMFALANPNLNHSLRDFIQRLPNEEVGTFESDSVPKSHLKNIAPMSGPTGYPLTRICAEYLNGADTYVNIKQDFYNSVYNLARKTDDPLEFVVRLAEESVKLGTHPDKALHCLFSQGILSEQHTYTTYGQMAEITRDVSINLWKAYEELGEQKRKEVGIIEFREKKFPEPVTFRRLTCHPE